MSLDELLDEPQPEPELVHFYCPVTIPWPGYASRLMLWGDEVEITPMIRHFGRDRNGNCWVDLASDRDAQLQRWGVVRYAAGPWPAHLPKIEPGSNEEKQAIEDAYRNAWAITTDVERAEALAEVRAKWGRPPRMSQSIMSFEG